jgi:hypothetical protein
MLSFIITDIKLEKGTPRVVGLFRLSYGEIYHCLLPLPQLRDKQTAAEVCTQMKRAKPSRQSTHKHVSGTRYSFITILFTIIIAIIIQTVIIGIA